MRGLLEITCENVEVDVDTYKNVRLKMMNCKDDFIVDLEPQAIIEHQDAKDLLEEIDTTYDEGFIMKWLMDKGSM